jgi:hypothetical protein
MGFDWPVFDHEPLAANRSWSATFDSFDQYHDDCYYVVELFEGAKQLATFTVQIGMEFAPDNHWEEPEFLPALRSRIADAAAAGKTNTTR